MKILMLVLLTKLLKRLDFQKNEFFPAIMSPEELAKTLRQRRKQARITQRDLAALSDLAVHTLSDLESGKGNPTLEVLSRVCGVLGLEIRLEPRRPGGFVSSPPSIATEDRPTG